ncbi:hypothetical protein [Burkholderia arboris]|uniref:hypothetical protein n=1 Tax=Burkholderia arboris TaxID=488730 RepID=UPI0030F04170
MTYSGFFVRDQLGDTVSGLQKRDGSSGSPDIILNGITPAPNPSVFTTTSGYHTDYGCDVTLEQANFVYLRALNTTSEQATGTAWFYYTPCNLLLWPSDWRSAAIQVDGMEMNCQPIVATAGNQVCVTDSFVWTPPDLPLDADHYCVVSWIDYPVHTDPGWTPLSELPRFNTLDDLLDFVVTHPNMGWRNTFDVPRDGSGWSRTSAIAGPPKGGQFHVGIGWSGMPEDATVSYSIPGGANGDPKTINRTLSPLNDSDGEYLSQTTWKAGFATSITINYTQGETPPQPGASVTAEVILPVQSMRSSTLRLARELQPGGFRKIHVVDEDGRRVGGEEDAFCIGSVTYRF